MSEINIIELIEKNPITKLSPKYNSKFINKIKEYFDDFEKNLFASSFYCYLNYDKNLDFVIDLDDVWKFLDFSKKSNALNLLENVFKIDIDYKYISNNELLLNRQEQKKGRGGHNVKKIFLTIKCFKSMCLKAGTKKADEIHEYYMKLEDILQDIINEDSNELRLQLEIKDKLIEEHKKVEGEYNKNINNITQNERQKLLLREFGNCGSLIYICKVKTFDNGSYVIKIGESRIGVRARFNEHKSKYDEVLLLDCFMVKNSKDFESYLHNIDKIKNSRVTYLKGHENERELFLIGKELTYNMVIDIIDKNIKNYDTDEKEIEKLRIENENLKLVNNMNNKEEIYNFIKELVNSNNMLVQKIDTHNNILMDEISDMKKIILQLQNKVNQKSVKTITTYNQQLPQIGPRLQKINPDTLEIFQYYDTVTECMNSDTKIKRPSLNKAIVENTIYCGFRWQLVSRDRDPEIITDLKPTKVTRLQNTGYIAKLDSEKKQILDVYLDRKTAARLNNYISISSLDDVVKYNKLSKGHYYILFHMCEEDVKNNFLERHGEPLLYKNGIGIYDKENNLIREYICKQDCIKGLRVSDKTLTKVLDKNIIYNNMYYKTIGEKLSMILISQ